MSVSPYLFGHSKPNEGHLTPSDAAKTLLSEEPDEPVVQEQPEPVEVETPKEEPAPAEAVPGEPVGEEPAPAGGMFWEE